MCEQFTYFGSGGNRNNFVILEECQKTCPESPNPCAYGTVGTVTQCAPGSVLATSCTGNQFCHVGATPTTTVCCNKPAFGDRCSQPLNLGVGNANLPRWYFNPLTQQCQQCYYKGLQGNENNFVTQEECQNSCMVNPCARGVPYRNQGITVQCSAANQNVCPAGYYCHVGASAQTSVCCQALEFPKMEVDVCKLPMSSGSGSDLQEGWFYNEESEKCEKFVYGGREENNNNFLDLELCRRSCHRGFLNPCKRGSTPEKDSNGNYKLCLVTKWNPIEVMAKGEGSLSLTRFYYDSKQRQCFAFNYFGSKGNSNNFVSREDCEKRCPIWLNPCAHGEPLEGAGDLPQQCQHRGTCPMGYFCHIGYEDSTSVCCPSKVQDPCHVPMNVGIGSLSMTRWFYNAQTRTCQQFSYSGYKGNENNFLLREHCEDACPTWENPCPMGDPLLNPNRKPQQCVVGSAQSCPGTHWCHLGTGPSTTVCCPGRQDPCILIQSEGEGSHLLPRFYFDLKEKQCLPFNFRGMKGNANNFLTKQDCESLCPVWMNPCPIPNNPTTSFSSLKIMISVVQCSKDNSICPDSYWCHIGNRPETSICCPNGK
ncbi:hypothetical protein L596_013771 [Steinernema carpocapsae]|uniref:BPTI/Kunitz inhibitor domain-containing protein n=1 Tax=Steinernema carpocapsae TaxID=34508 RepID=A0A4U5P153_STECR|nr:hypothetical protein L596_013771 [Steinernema carpocapsae]